MSRLAQKATGSIGWIRKLLRTRLKQMVVELTEDGKSEKITKSANFPDFWWLYGDIFLTEP